MGLLPAVMMFAGNVGYAMVCIVGSVMVIEGEITIGVVVAFIIFEKMFMLPAAFYYNTVEEKELTNALFPVSLDKPDNGGKGGVGVELPSGIDGEAPKGVFSFV